MLHIHLIHVPSYPCRQGKCLTSHVNPKGLSYSVSLAELGEQFHRHGQWPQAGWEWWKADADSGSQS